MVVSLACPGNFGGRQEVIVVFKRVIDCVKQVFSIVKRNFKLVPLVFLCINIQGETEKSARLIETDIA